MNVQKNNTEECHQRGLEKRIANHATQQTLRTMRDYPFELKRKFFMNIMIMLSGYKKVA